MTNLDEQINLIYVKIADAIDDWFNDRTIDPRQIAIDEIKALIADEVKKARIEEILEFQVTITASEKYRSTIDDQVHAYARVHRLAQDRIAELQKELEQ